ncbi:hypothetical protein [Hufsiella ginkgonis]|uniref:Uncharacterized protein n=1 Tax=Hufsiella ginkgonis TaxID=2695274 RepID=A0A7K1Y1V5_9SPHI|nr:hypothetical protein [Hufsiella ginkgonis]MXV17240.1 hypothetical protein [Hufsiella ginkgonis]
MRDKTSSAGHPAKQLLLLSVIGIQVLLFTASTRFGQPGRRIKSTGLPGRQSTAPVKADTAKRIIYSSFPSR